MSASQFVGGSLLTALLIATPIVPATAQPKALPRPEAPAKAKLGPSVHDDGGVWADSERQKIEEAVRNLYADYHCYVLIETYDGVPAGAGVVDLSDPSEVDKALNARRDELVKMADRRNTTLSLIFVQSKRGHRCSYNVGWPAYGKEEGQHILHEVHHLVGTRGIPDVLSYLRVAAAGRQVSGGDTESIHAVGGSSFHDGAGWWASKDQAKLKQLASDIMRRYKCKIFIETRPTLPARLARGQDLTDHFLASKLFGEWGNQRTTEVCSKDGLNINIFSCSEVHKFGVWVRWPTTGRRWTDEERELAQKLSAGVNKRLAGKFCPGMADALAFVRDTLEENRTLMARAPAVHLTSVSNEHPSIPETPPVVGDEGPTFRAAATEGGMSATDIDTVLAARGSASYEALTDFAKDQIKEGRKGKDLKDDLLTFLKLLNDKK